MPSVCVRRAVGLDFAPRPRLALIASASRPLAAFRRSSTTHTTSFPSTRSQSASGVASEIIFAAGQPAELPNRASELSAWKISYSKMGITRQFTFKSFAAAWRFMSLVADECKAKRHHPSWHNLYNQVTVEWTTHKPQGLSIKDVEMAEFCDRTADEIGLKQQET